jgi:hypothetical protein
VSCCKASLLVEFQFEFSRDWTIRLGCESAMTSR